MTRRYSDLGIIIVKTTCMHVDTRIKRYDSALLGLGHNHSKDNVYACGY